MPRPVEADGNAGAKRARDSALKGNGSKGGAGAPSKSGGPGAAAAGDAGGGKRARAPAALPPAALAPELTSPRAVAALAAAFRRGAPFPHIHVRDLFPRALLEAVRDELSAAS
jgi:Rps23 Pro-64 3,4-dihydroxylase Tpa1-like proline 4-hydroxylase